VRGPLTSALARNAAYVPDQRHFGTQTSCRSRYRAVVQVTAGTATAGSPAR